jgi:4-hydroxybenzoate polyprenyltransferase
MRLHLFSVKNIFQTICSFLVNSNSWIAFGTVAWVEQTLLLSNIGERPVAIELLVFASTFFIYNFQRLITLPDADADSLLNMHRWMRQNALLQKILMGVSLIIVLVALFFINIQAIGLLVVVGFISVFYAVPLPFTADFRLRDVGLLKPVYVALVWTAVCVVLPLLSLNKAVNNTAWLATHCFLFFMAITIPFDIRDLKFDQQNLKFPTLPMVAGINSTKMIAIVFLVLSGVVLWLIKPEYMIGIVSWYAVTAYLIITIGVKSNEYHYTFWLDGTIVLGYFLLVLADNYTAYIPLKC